MRSPSEPRSVEPASRPGPKSAPSRPDGLFIHVLTLLPVVGLLLGGCAGHLHCSFVSTNMADIMVRPSDARAVRMDCSECYWWVDEGNRLNIAGRGLAKSLLGEQFDREFYLSFVLDEPSKGVGRNYPLNHNSVRGFLKGGANVYRFQGTYGVFGSENRPGEQIAGAYRAFIVLSGARIFGGWSRPAPFMIFGNLTAVRDRADRGKSFRDKTEEDGYERKFAQPAGKSAATQPHGGEK